MATKKFEAHSPDHRGLPVVQVKIVKTKLGAYVVGIFNVGLDWRGKQEFEIEVEYPDGESHSTTTKKFSSKAEAFERGKAMAIEAAAREAKEKREAKKSPERRQREGKQKAEKSDVAFFKKQGRLDEKNARDLAKAESIASELGWESLWEEDPEEYQLGDGEEGPPPGGVYVCWLKDENGEVLGSLGGIGLSGNMNRDRDYARFEEANLAFEAARQKGLI